MIIQSRLKCPDEYVLISKHRHDFVCNKIFSLFNL